MMILSYIAVIYMQVVQSRGYDTYHYHQKPRSSALSQKYNHRLAYLPILMNLQPPTVPPSILL